MQHLILRPGPQLVMRAIRPPPDATDSRPRDDDVTGRAHEFLFELITIHAETTLADIFRLMEASPLLQKLYCRDFAEELCMEARKGATKPSASERAAHEGIEFLELYPFHGGQQEQLEVSEDLKRRVAEVDAGTVEFVSADGVFEHLEKPGCDALFEGLGGRSTREVAAAIRDIDDNQNAAAWLERVFEGAVVAKPQFRNRSGREFRKAFRAAER